MIYFYNSLLYSNGFEDKSIIKSIEEIKNDLEKAKEDAALKIEHPTLKMEEANKKSRKIRVCWFWLQNKWGKGSNLALNYWPKYTPYKNEFRVSKLTLIKYKAGQI